MYRFKIEELYDEQFLTKVVDRFRAYEVPRFRYLQRYYDVKTDILSRQMDEGKPNNRLAHGFARYITNMATSYFAGKPVKYIAGDPEYQSLLDGQLKNNYIDTVNFEVSKEGSKKGIGFYLLFLDEGGDLRIKKCDAETVIPIYSSKLGEFIEGCIRIWDEYDIDGVLTAQYAALYDKKNIITYKRTSGVGTYRLQNTESHMFDDVPVIVVWNNEEMEGDYAPHIPLLDAYDKAQSDTANDMEYFTDAYLCIAGAGELTEGAADGGDDSREAQRRAYDLRKNRILFLDEKGQAEWLVKNTNDTAVENYKDRLYRDIFFLSQVPALSDESFAGNLSGVAIRYKLIGLEELAIMKQTKFEAAQKKLINLVTDYINLRYNKNFDPETVTRKYERNIVNNVEEIIGNARNLENIVSKETQLSMLPKEIVDSPADELERIRKEQGVPQIDIEGL